jgi:ABC-type transporter Mla subunit MlaD
MNQRAMFLRVGALLVFSVAAIVVLILVLTSDRWHRGHNYETYFRESVQGLEIGAPVKYRGVTLGNVYNIGLVSAEYGATADEQVMDPTYRMIVVRFKVNPRRIGRLPDTATAVRIGLRAKLANQGLTGVMFLELDFVPPDQNPPQAVPWVPDEDYIPSIPSTFAQVQDMVTQLLTSLDKIDYAGMLRNVNGLVSDVRRELDDGGDAQAVLAQARRTIADVQSRIDAADIPALSAQLRSTAEAFGQLAQGGPTRDVIAQARAALGRLARLTDELSQVSRHADTGLSDTEAELTPILRDLRAAMANLREATEAIRRDPGSVLLQGPPPRDRAP